MASTQTVAGQCAAHHVRRSQLEGSILRPWDAARSMGVLSPRGCKPDDSNSTEGAPGPRPRMFPEPGRKCREHPATQMAHIETERGDQKSSLCGLHAVGRRTMRHASCAAQPTRGPSFETSGCSKVQTSRNEAGAQTRMGVRWLLPNRGAALHEHRSKIESNHRQSVVSTRRSEETRDT